MKINSEVTGKELIKLPAQWKVYLSHLKKYLSNEDVSAIVKDRILRPYAYFCPNGKQEEFIKQIAHSADKTKIPVNTLFAANGIGKCLPLTSPILMADGTWKELGKIVIGDMVMGHDYKKTKIATPTKVLQTSRAGIKEVYKISFKDGGHVIASKEHSFPIKLRSGRKSNIEKITLEEMMSRNVKYVGGKLKFQQPKSIDFNTTNNLPIDPYLLGVLLGDGTLSKGNIEITSISPEIISKITKICNRDGYELRQRKDKKQYGIVDLTKQGRLRKSLEEMNLRVKSGEKFIPYIYKTSSIDDRKELLSGLIDTDGTFNEYCTKSDELAKDFIWLVRSLGGSAKDKIRIVNNDFTKNTDIPYHRIYWRFDYNLPLAIEKKQRVGKNQVEYSNRIVSNIENIGMVECGDIYVEHESHTYISYDFISTGNTHVLAQIGLNIVYGCQNGWFDYPLFHDYPFQTSKLWWHISTATGIGRLMKEIRLNYPRDRYKIGKTPNSQRENMVTFDNGWVLYCFTFDQDVSVFETESVDLITVDEPCYESIWSALKSRVRMGCLRIMVMTPLEVEPFIKDEIDGQSGDGIYFSMTASLFSACARRGVRGHLDPDIIDDMIKNYKPDEIKSRVYGDFMFFSEQIYPTYGDANFVKPDDFPINPKVDRIYNVVDPADGRFCAGIWAAFQPTGRVVIFTESPIDKSSPFWEMRRMDATYEDEILDFIELENSHEINKVNYRIMDRRFGWERRRQGTISAEFLRISTKRGKPMIFNKSYSSNRGESGVGELTYGHQIVQEFLKLMEDGFPRLVIWNTCYHTHNGMRHYVRKLARNQHELGKAVAETKPIEKYKDFPDVVRYLCCAIHLGVVVFQESDENKSTKSEKKLDRVIPINKSMHDTILGRLRKY